MRWIRGVFFLLVAGSAFGGRPPIRMFTTEDGLVRNWITRIYRDSKGFLWFCTVEGVSIFDGQHFTNFTSRDGLPSRFVNDVVETSSGEYWLATGSGLARLSLRHPVDAPAFTTFKLGASDAANRIDRLVEDSKHQIWCNTADGLYRSSTIATQPFHVEKVSLPEPMGTQLSDLLIDSNKRLWVLSSSSLVLRAEDGTWKNATAVAGLLQEANALTQDSAGRIWIGCRNSLLAIRVDQGGSTQIVARYSGLAGGGTITSLIADPHDDLWVGARLLVRFHPMPSKTAPAYQTIPVQSVLLPLFPEGLSVDREGNIWVGVGNSGVARICRRSSELFGTEDGFVSPAVIGVTAGINGNIFAITADRTLHEFVNGRFVPRSRVIPSNAKQTGWGQDQVALEDRVGHWWFRKWSRGSVLSPHQRLALARSLGPSRLHLPRRVARRHDPASVSGLAWRYLGGYCAGDCEVRSRHPPLGEAELAR